MRELPILAWRILIFFAEARGGASHFLKADVPQK